MAQGRNEQCACGSGKKYKKCCLGKKPRTNTVRIAWQGKKFPEQMRLYPDGRVEIFEGGVSIQNCTMQLESSFQRATKKKVLFNIPLPNGLLVGDVHSAMSRYDVFAAVDTNTREIRGQSISVTQVIIGDQTIAGDEVRLDFRLGPAFERRGKAAQPEKIGWWLVSSAVTNTEFFHGKRVGLLVDAHLDELDDINARTSPIFEGYCLPHNQILVYATADSAETAVNQLFRECDKYASKILHALDSFDSLFECEIPPAVEGEFSIRTWEPSLIETL